jgi:hypothetical protein
MAMTLSRRALSMLATLVRFDMAAGIAIAVTLLVWLYWHGAI